LNLLQVNALELSYGSCADVGHFSKRQLQKEGTASDVNPFPSGRHTPKLQVCYVWVVPFEVIWILPSFKCILWQKWKE